MKKKPAHQCALRTSISLPPQLYDAAVAAMRSEGFTAFSDYIQHLIRCARAAGTTPSR